MYMYGTGLWGYITPPPHELIWGKLVDLKTWFLTKEREIKFIDLSCDRSCLIGFCTKWNVVYLPYLYFYYNFDLMQMLGIPDRFIP